MKITVLSDYLFCLYNSGWYFFLFNPYYRCNLQ